MHVYSAHEPTVSGVDNDSTVDTEGING